MKYEEIHSATYILYDQYLELKKELEEKQKIIDEALDIIYNHNELQQMLGGTIRLNVLKIQQILERGASDG